jgi:hypothetical protein
LACGDEHAVDIGASDARLAYIYVRRFDLGLRAPDALRSPGASATLVTLDRRLATTARVGVAVELTTDWSRGDEEEMANQRNPVEDHYTARISAR